MTIWYRYLFKQLIQSFCFLLSLIFIMYIVIDFSIRGIKILSHNTSFFDIALNYLRYFSIYFDLFASISFLLASLKVLIDCNLHQELTALQMAGLSKRKLLSPFFFLAALLLFTSYANNQWFSPQSEEVAEKFVSTHSLKKGKRKKVFSAALKDDSELIYQNFVKDSAELRDVYWIRSLEDIWHMKLLKIDSFPPEALFADHLVRNEAGVLEKKDSFSSRLFPELSIDKEVIVQKSIPFENQSLSRLVKQALIPSSEQHKAIAHLYYKIIWGLVPLLILLAISLKTFSFSRGKSPFLFVACTLFVLIGFITWLNGMLILAENQVLSPIAALCAPIFLIFAMILPPFFKRQA